MKYNIEVDSDTKFVIRFALSTRIEFIKNQLAIAKQCNVDSSVKYWEGELENVTNAVYVIDHNTKMIW